MSKEESVESKDLRRKESLVRAYKKALHLTIFLFAVIVVCVSLATDTRLNMVAELVLIVIGMISVVSMFLIIVLILNPLHSIAGYFSNIS